MKSAYICIYMVEPQVIDPNRAAAQNWLLTFYIHLVFFLGQNKSPCKILSELVEKQQSYNYFFAAADLRQICPKVWNTEIQLNLVLYPWWSRFPPWMFFLRLWGSYNACLAKLGWNHHLFHEISHLMLYHIHEDWLKTIKFVQKYEILKFPQLEFSWIVNKTI